MLSKVDPIEIDQIGTSSPGIADPAIDTFVPGFQPASATRITQTETIYIVNDEGVIRPYIKVVERAIDNDKHGGLRKGIKR